MQLLRVAIKFDFFEIAGINQKVFYPFFASVRDGITPDLVGQTN